MDKATIQRLEARLAALYEERRAVCNEQTLLPGNSSAQLRQNWRNEEERRAGLRGIDQAIDGVERELRFLREKGGR